MDAAVRLERPGGPGGGERGAFPAEHELARREPACRRATVEPREVERVPALRQEDVRVGPRDLVDQRPQELVLGPFERHVAEADRPDPTVRRRDPPAALPRDADLELGERDRGRGVVDRLRRLRRHQVGAAADDGRERVEGVAEVVELGDGQVDVVEHEPRVAAPGVDLPRQGAPAAMARGGDAEERRGPCGRGSRGARPRGRPGDVGRSARVRRRSSEVGLRAADEERGPVLHGGAPDAARTALLRPQDDRAAVPALGDVEQPPVGRRGRPVHGQGRAGFGGRPPPGAGPRGR